MLKYARKLGNKILNRKSKVCNEDDEKKRLAGQTKDELHQPKDKDVVQFDNVKMIERFKMVTVGDEVEDVDQEFDQGITSIEIQKYGGGLGYGAMITFGSGKNQKKLADVGMLSPKVAIRIDSAQAFNVLHNHAEADKAVIQIQHIKTTPGQEGKGISRTHFFLRFDVSQSSNCHEKILKLEKWKHQLCAGKGASIHDCQNLHANQIYTAPVIAVDDEEHKEQPEINSGASSTSGTEPDNDPEGGKPDDADPVNEKSSAERREEFKQRLAEQFSGGANALLAKMDKGVTRRLAANDSNMDHAFSMLWILPLLVVFVFWFKRYIVTKNNDDIVEDDVEEENDLSNIV